MDAIIRSGKVLNLYILILFFIETINNNTLLNNILIIENTKLKRNKKY